MTIHPWINFNGNAEEAFTFYKSVFGGEFTKITRFKDIATPEFPVADSDADKIMHIALAIGDSQLLIGNDVPSFLGTVNEQENRSKIKVAVDSEAEAQRIFDELSVGGQVEIPVGDGSWFGMFRDMYGIEWIVEFDPTE